ncbi:hypothetical protein QUR76_03380 [Arcobacter cryaerophilus gv. pseudocryaerophilus]|mgnify:FL=1|jgi:hypothetical protein|uniref:Uncharacterized protein n=3 Tax=unclassified Arcobacter TaxID=2593671 RepID=A0AA96RC73_9BACT|nr:hypothetical protein RMQ65_04715 [Arcobacter sp. AZ-2023]WPD06236.1 hypothetical protein QUR76_03380 [Arcobacter sp. DSM 115956]WPD08327.1 hypothetical protein QUR78_03380 [Arcobacter sp. DSM 115955]WNL32592.1 hypothetical protein RMQ67_03380 [Arcobacter sp. AZ-2023]WNP38742.1 hypothetical protein RJG58_03380 [Arcobacter sp. AZ-2023]
METTNTNPENQISENQEQKEDDKKDKTLLIKRVLFITIGVLLLFLIILATIFIFKSEESKEPTESSPPIESSAKTNENNTENVPSEPEIKETKFDFNNLEPEKLNEQLELLTNKNMEYQKEKEQKILEEEKKLSPVFNLVNNLKDKEEIKKEENSIVSSEDNKKEEISKIEEIKEDKKEEIISEKKDVATSTSNETKTQNETSNINSNSKKEETTKITESLTFVKLINVAKIKGDLNKKYFDKVIEVNANVLLCRDDENIIELYYGPFLEDEIRDNLLSKLIKNGFKEAYSLEMTKEEFDKRCNY